MNSLPKITAGIYSLFVEQGADMAFFAEGVHFDGDTGLFRPTAKWSMLDTPKGALGK